MITALTSNQMIAPNVWIDPRNNNNYFLSPCNIPEQQIQSLTDLRAIPLRGHRHGEADATGYGEQAHSHRGAHGSGSLPDPAEHRYLCAAAR